MSVCVCVCVCVCGGGGAGQVQDVIHKILHSGSLNDPMCQLLVPPPPPPLIMIAPIQQCSAATLSMNPGWGGGGYSVLKRVLTTVQVSRNVAVVSQINTKTKGGGLCSHYKCP